MNEKFIEPNSIAAIPAESLLVGRLRSLRAEADNLPGPNAEVAKFLVEERDVLGFGSEAIGTDAGQGYHQRPPYPCHYYMHGAGRYGLQCLANLDLLPATGAMLICPPLKIERGSGSPLRVLALVAD